MMPLLRIGTTPTLRSVGGVVVMECTVLVHVLGNPISMNPIKDL